MRWTRLGAALVAATASGCASNTPQETRPGPPVVFTSTGRVPPGGTETDVLWLPAGYRRDGTRRGVVFCHGAGELATTPLAGAPAGKAKETELLRAVASVYPVVMFDAGVLGTGTTSSENWGNPNAVTRLGQAITWLQTATTGGGARTGPVLLIGLSMGHALAMNYAEANPSGVRAIAGILPVVDLDRMRDTEPGVRAYISDAWGSGPWVGPGNPPLPGGANPARPANYSKITAIPHRLYYASDDPAIDPASVFALENGLGPEASAVDLGPGGHSDLSVGRIPPEDLLRFLAANA